MPRRATTESYARRLGKVAAHIAAHLDDPLDLDRLAGVACLSPYHFHRIYRALWGETAAETLSRLRLGRAAVQLLTTTEPMTQIVPNSAVYKHGARKWRPLLCSHAPPATDRPRPYVDHARWYGGGLHGDLCGSMGRAPFREDAPCREAHAARASRDAMTASGA
jgi:AraC family transcriptional regulator